MKISFSKCFSYRLLSSQPTMDIKTFIFLDSETTGLPFYESNRTRITELSLIAVQSDHISLGVFPRIQDKLNLCFNPRKLISEDASKITGLTNELLEFQTEFNSSCFNILQQFLNVHRKPICLVAHNGNKFDYPILKAEIHKTGNELENDIFCIDSLLAFRSLHDITLANEIPREPIEVDSNTSLDLDDGFDSALNELLDNIERASPTPTKLTVEEIQKMNETTPVKNRAHFKKSGVKRKKMFTKTPSFALGNLYQRLTSKVPVDAHRAECDVNMLIECVATVGQPFIDWCNVNAKRFCDIQMMMPRKAILT